MRGVCPTTKFIIGGPYVIVMGETACREVGADVAIVGEFDNNTGETLERIMRMPSGETATFEMERTDVNVVPIPDWDFMPPSDYWPYL